MNTALTGAEDVRWDLTCFYSGINDPKLDDDILLYTKKAKEFFEKHYGKLSETLPEAIRDYAELVLISNAPGHFVGLLSAVDTANASYKMKAAELDRIYSKIAAEYLEFFTIELAHLSDDVVQKHAENDSEVKRHLPFINDIREEKSHMLSLEVESALTKRSPFGVGAWSELAEELEADIRISYKNEAFPLPAMLAKMQTEKDQNERANIMKATNAALGGLFAKYAAQTLFMVAGKNEVEDKERHYPHPMSARNRDNKLSDATVDALHAAVTQTTPLVKRYYLLKARILGLSTLKWSDRNAPLPFSDTKVVPWDKAVETVIAAYNSFSPTLANLVQEMLDKRHIDAPPGNTKHGGAFNSSCILPNNEAASFSLLNYQGTPEDVMTFAHEVGHGVHGILASRAQGPLLNHAPIALCETASIFGEMTTFNFVKKELEKSGNPEAILALLMDKLDGVMNTVVRQIGFSNFEKRLHGWNNNNQKWEGVKKRSAEEIGSIFAEETQKLYGKNGEVFTYEDTENLWTYISHFHRPFYVYGYAVGELLTQSFYASANSFGDRFEPMYLDTLRAGSSKDAKELLAPFGLNPEDGTFWEKGIKVAIEDRLTEAESLAKELHLLT